MDKAMTTAGSQLPGRQRWPGGQAARQAGMEFMAALREERVRPGLW